MDEINITIVEVVIDKYVDKSFDYICPSSIEISIGTFVLVPFKTYKLYGCVIAVKDKSLCHHSKLKSVEKVFSLIPPLKKELLSLAFWISDYYACPLGVIIKSIVPSYLFKNVKQRKDISSFQMSYKKSSLVLNEEQDDALKCIISDEDKSKKNVFLLWGITGSGKTEVYLRAIENALNNGKSALIIVPEIALTPSLINIFKCRFSEPIAVFHSKIKDSKRCEDWIKTAKGEIRIAIGARSAVFAPLNNLGIIVVDEEHERTYKQEDAPRYNARDIAILRGQIENATVILCSATPSLESFYNASTGKYYLLKLTKRVSNNPLPNVTLIDMEKEYKIKKKQFLFSDKLLSMIEERLKKKEQTILFLNKRGFANCLICSSCGEMMKCSDCSVLLTYHKHDNKLMCHRCGKINDLIKECVACKKNKLKLMGFGTEKVEKQIKSIFGEAKILRIDSDSVSGKDVLEKKLDEFINGNIDILIGTQMIAKGIHSERVTLVGVLAADLPLNIPNFRAGENTFQLITQVIGRAGRGVKNGEALIQAFNVKNPIIQNAITQDYISFYETEMHFRKILNYPPYIRFILITVLESDEIKAAKSSYQFYYILKETKDFKYVKIYPPIPSPISKIKKKFRFQILISVKVMKSAVKVINFVLNKNFPTQLKNFIVDVDPYTMI